MGAATFKGLVQWESEFEGERSVDMFSATANDPKELFDRLLDTVFDGKLLSVEIKYVGSD